jgi:hypothetical protein
MTDIFEQLDGLWGTELPVTLPDLVAELPAGTLFTETDDRGRTHRMVKLFRGQVGIDNGYAVRGFTYGDSIDDGYSIEVTHVQIPAPNDAAIEQAAKAILAVGLVDEPLKPVAEQVQQLWWNTPARERAVAQARAAITALLRTA